MPPFGKDCAEKPVWDFVLRLIWLSSYLPDLAR